MYNERNMCGCMGLEETGTNFKGTQRNFLGQGIILYHFGDASYIKIDICYNSLNYTLKMGTFYYM